MEDEQTQEQTTVAPERELSVSEVLDRNAKLLLTMLSIIVIIGGAVFWVQTKIAGLESSQQQDHDHYQWQIQDLQKQLVAQAMDTDKRETAMEHHQQETDGRIDGLKMNVVEMQYTLNHKSTP